MLWKNKPALCQGYCIKYLIQKFLDTLPSGSLPPLWPPLGSWVARLCSATLWSLWTGASAQPPWIPRGFYLSFSDVFFVHLRIRRGGVEQISVTSCIQFIQFNMYGVLPGCISVYYTHTDANRGQKRALNPLELEFMGGCKQPCRCLELNLSHIEEYPVLSATEPYLKLQVTHYL